MSSRKKLGANLPRGNYSVDVFGTLFPNRSGWDFENALRQTAFFGSNGELETVILRYGITASPFGPCRCGIRQDNRGFSTVLFSVDASAFIPNPFEYVCKVVSNPSLAMELVEKLEDFFSSVQML
jgi:hypothetical protein